MEDMQKELEKSSMQIDHTLNNDLTSIISVNSSKFTPFINLFWQQQKKLFKCSNKGVRFDPMLIRFCLSLWSNSSSAYEELRNFNVLSYRVLEHSVIIKILHSPRQVLQKKF